MRWSWMLLGGALSLGCAGMSRGLTQPVGAELPTKETVYLVPLEEAMRMARTLLESQRFGVFEQENGTVLLTQAWEPGNRPRGAKSFERYYVKGERLGPRQSIVRVFRLRYEEYALDNGGAADNNGMSPREAETLARGIIQPSNLSTPTIGSPPNPNGIRYNQSEFQPLPFEGAPQLEGFKPAVGYRDLVIEGELLTRLERVPALEIVGGAASGPAQSLVMEAEEGEASARPAECGEPLAGAEPLLARGGTVLVADPLGTREVPAQALRLLCAASAQGPEALGLSLPSTEQRLLDAYLASEGRTSDVQTLLLHGAFWRRPYQDGRGSHATLWLIEQARRLRASGRAVSLVAIDSTGASGNAREEEMASNVLAFREKNADAWMLVLAGGVHVRTQGVAWDSDFEPLGARLVRARPGVKALDVGFERGTQFACRYNVWEKVECNVFALSPAEEARQAPGTAPGVQLFAEPSQDGFHGRLHVGALTASPPALKPDTRAHQAAAK